MFKFKGKDIVTEGEQDTAVATEKPSIATEDQLGASLSSFVAIQFFFKVELWAIKKKQVS